MGEENLFDKGIYYFDFNVSIAKGIQTDLNSLDINYKNNDTRFFMSALDRFINDQVYLIIREE